MEIRPLPQKCETPGCECDGTLCLCPACHPDAPHFIESNGDVITTKCAECGLVTGMYLVQGEIIGE